MALCAALLVVPVVTAILGALGFLTWEGELLSTETIAAVNARRFAQGGRLYGDWREMPYILTQYGPALYLPPALATRALSLDLRGTLIVGRAISLTAFLTVMFLLALVGRKLEIPWSVAAVPVALLVGTELMTQFGAMLRADMPALCLEVLGLFLLQQGTSVRSALMALAPLCLACAYKQTAVMGSLAAIAWLLMARQLSRALAVAVGFGATAAIGVATAQAITGGRFLLGTLFGVLFRNDWAQVPAIAMYARSAWPLVLAGVIALLVPQARRRLGPFAYFFILGLIWGIVGTRHKGAWVQYWFEAAASGTIALAALLRVWPRAGLAVCGLWAAWQCTASAPRLPLAAAALGSPVVTRNVRATYDVLVEEVHAEPGTLLSQDAFLAVVSGHPDLATDTFDVAAFIDAKLTDAPRWRELIESRQCDPIVMTAPVDSRAWWPEAWTRAMEGRYRLARVLPSGHRIYRPIRPAGPSP